MPKSRTNKDRKQKVVKYKKSKKMSKAPEMKQFRQIPVWNSNDEFPIKGDELSALYNYFNQFFPAVNAIQQIFARGIQGGKINLNYEYEDGTPVPQSEVADYTKKLQEYFESKAKEAEENSQADDIKSAFSVPAVDDGKTEAKIVSLTGESISKETT